ncbi:hypothetical protein TNCV_347111 [Trichonephila clavipes]|nr:hypothetical protein TNCV_347111 [Trichonephila clavipes]
MSGDLGGLGIELPLSILLAWGTFSHFQTPAGLSWEQDEATIKAEPGDVLRRAWTATAGSDIVQSGRPIFDDFFQHLWPYIGNNTANVVFQMVKRLWLIRIDQ